MNEIPTTVLVVDDEIQIRRFLRTGFELDGFAVAEAETGAEALRATTLKPSDLVILDLGLPDMDGAEVLERLRSWSSVPLIVLSVRGSEAEKVRLLELGADDYMVKPFGMAELAGARPFGDAPAAALGARRACGQVRRAVDRLHGAGGVRQRPPADADAEGISAAADRLRSIPAMSSPTSSYCARFGATSTSTIPIICASSCANCGARSNPTRPSRISC